MKERKVKGTLRMVSMISLCLVLVAIFSMEVLAAEKRTLKIFAPDAPFCLSLGTDVVKEYEKETGVKVVLEMFPYDECHEKTMFELVTGSPSYDLLIADSIWSGQVMKSGRVYPLGEFDKPGLPPLQLENLHMITATNYHSSEGVLYGIPMNEPAGVMMYRKDLLAQYGFSEPPETWAEFEEYAKKLTFDLDGDGRTDVFGTVLIEIEQDCGYSQWTQRLVGFRAIEGKTYLFNEKDEPIFNHPTGVKALELLGDVLPYCPPATLSYGYGEAMTAYKQGKVALLVHWDDASAGFEDPAESKVAGKIGYTIFPYAEKDRPYSGIASSWCMFINRASEDSDEAYKFLAWMTEGKAYEIMARGSSLSAVSWLPLRNDPTILEQKPWWRVWKIREERGMDVKQIPTQYPQFTEVQRIIWEETTRYLGKEKTAKGAIEDAWKRVYELMEKAGYYK